MFATFIVRTALRLSLSKVDRLQYSAFGRPRLPEETELRGALYGIIR